MQFWFLLVTSALPVLKVVLLAAVGAALAHKGVLDAKGRNSLSRVVFYVFVPSLTFSKLAASVDLHNIVRWWFLPANIFISLSLGCIVGWVLARLLGVPKWLRPHIMCCTASANAGNLPLILVAALCSSTSAPAVIADAVPPGQCAELGIAYIVFAMWVAGLFQFSIVNYLLSPRAQDPPAPDTLPTVLHERPGHLRLGPGYASSADALELVLLRTGHAGSSSAEAEAAPGVLPHRAPEEECQAEALMPQLAEEEHLHQHMRHQQHGQQRTCSAMSSAAGSGASSSGSSAAEEGSHAAGLEPDLDADELADRRARSLSVHAGTRDSSSSIVMESMVGALKLAAKQQHRQQQEEAAKQASGHSGSDPRPLQIRLESNSGTGHEVGILGAAQPRHKPCSEVPRAAKGPTIPWAQIFNLPVLSAFAGLTVGCTPPLKHLIIGPGAPLGFLRDCMEMLGAAMVPCMILVLGAVLYKGPGKADVSFRTIVVVCTARLILLPLLGTAVVLGVQWMGLFTPPNSLFTLVLLLGVSTPTAINVQTLATLHQNGEAEVSCLLFWQYLGAMLSLPLLLTMYFRIL